MLPSIGTNMESIMIRIDSGLLGAGVVRPNVIYRLLDWLISISLVLVVVIDYRVYRW